jgi:ubiquinone biosynthesis monooxygenase Coq7
MLKDIELQYDHLPLEAGDVRDLRSDHAGEYGAVAIYIGMLDVTRDPGLRRFARRHLLAETRHLRFFDRFLPASGKSRLLPIWWLAGWLLGAGSALVGPRAAYRTVAAVERFVEHHYGEQIESMRLRPGLEPLATRLAQFCADEVHHREDAERAGAASTGIGGRTWDALVGGGSALGVVVARRV